MASAERVRWAGCQAAGTASCSRQLALHPPAPPQPLAGLHSLPTAPGHPTPTHPAQPRPHHTPTPTTSSPPPLVPSRLSSLGRLPLSSALTCSSFCATSWLLYRIRAALSAAEASRSRSCATGAQKTGWRRYPANCTLPAPAGTTAATAGQAQRECTAASSTTWAPSLQPAAAPGAALRPWPAAPPAPHRACAPPRPAGCRSAPPE